MNRRLVTALTVDIFKTYMLVQNSHLSSAKRPSKFLTQTDERGHLVIRTGDLFNNRYVAGKPLGQGSFGRVVLASDQNIPNTYVAIKILKASKIFYDKGREEIAFLEVLNAASPEITTRYNESFMHGDHLCIVTEALGMNLYQLLKSINLRGFPLQTLRLWARQLFAMFARLRQSDLCLIHTDVKPENVLVPFNNVNIESIKLCDFGSSIIYPKGKMYSYIQSRFYRSPEVLFKSPYSFQIDMWSLGVMFVELHTGSPVFPATSSPMLCFMMLEVLGPMPAEMVVVMDGAAGIYCIRQHLREYFCLHDDGYFDMHAAQLRALGFDAASTFLPTELVLAAGVKAPSRDQRRDLHDLIINKNFLNSVGHTEADYTIFCELISNLVCWDPSLRWTPEKALQCRFISSLE